MLPKLLVAGSNPVARSNRKSQNLSLSGRLPVVENRPLFASQRALIGTVDCPALSASQLRADDLDYVVGD